MDIIHMICSAVWVVAVGTVRTLLFLLELAEAWSALGKRKRASRGTISRNAN